MTLKTRKLNIEIIKTYITNALKDNRFKNSYDAVEHISDLFCIADPLRIAKRIIKHGNKL